MLSSRYLHATLWLGLCLTTVSSSNILIVSNCPSKSHSHWFKDMASLLGSQRHQIVLLDTLPEKTKLNGVTQYLLENAYTFDELLSNHEELSENDWALHNIYILTVYTVESCFNLLNSKGFKTFLNDYRGKHFDLIILDYPCMSFMALVPFFQNPPLILATPYSDPASTLASVGQFDNPSYVPTKLMQYTPSMSFIERFTNTIIYTAEFLIIRLYESSEQQKIVDKVFGDHLPRLWDIEMNTYLVMVNTFPVFPGPKPISPAVIPIGGLHIKKPKPLPKELEDFMEGAKHGVILFSMGTNILSSNMKDEKRRMFLNVFRELPQRVIWKWEKDFPDKLPENVMVKHWVPQNAILAHNNTVLFISHGGLLSTQESLYYGVPMVTIPIFIDQHANSATLERMKIGIHLKYNTITHQSLLNAIHKVIEDSGYRSGMKTMSELIQDQPMTARETFLFWVGYVLRHPHAAPLRRPHLPFYQLLLLDVIAVALAVLIITIFVLYKITKYLCCCLFSKNTLKKKKD